MTATETWGLGGQRHFDIPNDIVFSMQAPVGPHIQLLDYGFTVDAGEGLISEQTMAGLEGAVGERQDLPPVALEAEPEALAQWAEGLIEDAFYPRAGLLVQSLGMSAESFLTGTKISREINTAMRLVLPDNEHGLTVLDLFNGDEEACKYTLFAGLYNVRKHAMQQKEQDFAFQEQVLMRAAAGIGISLDSYEHAIQVVNDSPLFFEWLGGAGSPTSLITAVEALLYDRETRQELSEFLTQAGQVLLSPGAQQALSEQNMLPAGELSVRGDQSDVIVYEEEVAALVTELSQDPVKSLYFVMYVMKYDSHRALMDYLYRRFNKQVPGKQDLPVVVDEGDQEDDGSQT